MLSYNYKGDFLMNNIIYINQIGKAHINDSKSCDDAVYISDTGDVICVADGVSNSEYGGIGAKFLVESIGKHISNPSNKHCFENETSDEIRKNICSMIDKIITHSCKKYKTTNREAFASTFLASIKTSDNNITVIHAGDGCIFGQPNTNQECGVTVISCPDNSPSGAVYSAGHKEQKSRMRVFHINPNDYKAIILCTDGFSDPYFDPSSQAFDMSELAKIFRISNSKALMRLVSEYHINSFNITDDISCVIYKTTDKESSNDYDFAVFDYNDNVTKKHEKIQNEAIEQQDSPAPKSIHINKSKANKKAIIQISKSTIVSIIAVFSLVACLATFSLLNARINALSEANRKQDEKISTLILNIEELSNELEKSEKNTPEITDNSDERECNNIGTNLETLDQKIPTNNEESFAQDDEPVG